MSHEKIALPSSNYSSLVNAPSSLGRANNSTQSTIHSSKVLHQWMNYTSTVSVWAWLHKMSEANGNVVQFPQEYQCVPVVYDKTGKTILLYQLIEVIDGAIDYDDIQEHYPDLSYSQIVNVFAFLRNVAQFNIVDADLDVIEEQLIEANPEFQHMLLESIQHSTDVEGLRVLNLQ